MSDVPPNRDRRYALIFAVGATVLAYLGGAFSGTFRTFPYPQLLKPPFEALAARWEKRAAVTGPETTTGLWHPPHSDQTGVTEHTSGETFDGYTLYASAPKSGAYLIDMNGEVVHEWDAPFRDVWSENPPHVDDPVPEKNIYWRRARLLPDGGVVGTYVGTGSTPWGYGMVRLDRDSNVVWKYSAHTHHDFDVRPDGSVFALVQEFRDTDAHPVPGVPHMQNPVMNDSLVRLSPDGEEMDRLSLLDLLADSPYRDILRSYPKNIHPDIDVTWDPLHTNDVEVVGPEFAAHYEFVEPDHLLISWRGNDFIALVDMDEKRIVWATRGYWRHQHDPDPLPNGHIMIFDNRGHGGPEGPSRVLEYDPTTGGIVWSYLGTRDDPFFSNVVSSQDPLPSGNVLITSSLPGRIFEVTRAGDVVWEFQNPERRTHEGNTFVALTCGARRYAPEEVSFLDP